MINDKIISEIESTYKDLKFKTTINKNEITISNIKSVFDNERIFNKMEDICYFIIKEEKKKGGDYLISNNEENIKLTLNLD